MRKVSARVIDLEGKVRKSMHLIRLKWATALALAVVVTGAGVAAVVPGALAAAEDAAKVKAEQDAKRAAAAVSKKHDELISRTIAGDARGLKAMAMFHPEFVAVDTDGKQTTADEELAGLSRLKLESNKIKKYQVITVGPFAIARGVAHTKGTYNGKDISGVHPFIQVWTLNPARIQAGVTSFAAAAESDMMLAASINLE